MEVYFLCLFAYFCGTVPFAKIVAAKHGVDIQKKGSGNVGFANVFRVIGPKPAYVVLIADIAKGLTPALIALQLVTTRQAVAVGTFAILGHVFSIWLKFRGGKGVATAFGVLLAIFPVVALATVSVYLATLLISRTFPLASLVAAASLPLFGIFFEPAYAGWFCALTLFAIWTHRNNIRGARQDKEMLT